MAIILCSEMLEPKWFDQNRAEKDERRCALSSCNGVFFNWCVMLLGKRAKAYPALSRSSPKGQRVKYKCKSRTRGITVQSSVAQAYTTDTSTHRWRYLCIDIQVVGPQLKCSIRVCFNPYNRYLSDWSMLDFFFRNSLPLFLSNLWVGIKPPPDSYVFDSGHP